MSQQSRVAAAGLVLAITMSSAHGAASWKQALHDRLREQPQICAPVPTPAQSPYLTHIAAESIIPPLFSLSVSDETTIAQLSAVFPKRWALPPESRPRAIAYASAQPYEDPSIPRAEVGWKLFECVFILMSLFVGLCLVLRIVDHETKPHRIERRRTPRPR